VFLGTLKIGQISETRGFLGKTQEHQKLFTGREKNFYRNPTNAFTRDHVVTRCIGGIGMKVTFGPWETFGSTTRSLTLLSDPHCMPYLLTELINTLAAG